MGRDVIRAAKIDDSQRILRPYLEAVGATVQSIASVGRSCPDCIVGFRGVTDLAEFKTGKRGLSPGQESWRRKWRGSPVWILRSREDCDRMLLDMRRRGQVLRSTVPMLGSAHAETE